MKQEYLRPAIWTTAICQEQLLASESTPSDHGSSINGGSTTDGGKTSDGYDYGPGRAKGFFGDDWESWEEDSE